jgi:hypothetical protein
MAIVVTVPRDSSLQLRLIVGSNPETGAPIVNSSYCFIWSSEVCP